MINKILLATGGSPGALRAAELAGELVEKFDVEVVVLYVLPPLPALSAVADALGEPGWSGSAAAMRGFEKAGQEILTRTTQGFQGGVSDYTVRLEHGHPAETICEVATDEQADIVVLGRRGESQTTIFALGSVSEQVSRCAPCSVLVVR